MSPRRRWLLQAVAGALPGSAAAEAAIGSHAKAAGGDDAIHPDRPLRFPRDHGAHPGAGIEWWYATGWLDTGDERAPIGWQLTFFRSRTGLAGDLPGRFAARQLLFAHAAVSEIGAGRHRHAQRVARWNGEPGRTADDTQAAHDDTALRLDAWALRRGPDGVYRAELPAPDAGFTLSMALTPTQPLLLQGQAGHSRKGPRLEHASHYYSLPHLAVQATLQLGNRRLQLPGRGWLDHEWSDQLMPPGAVGWDWIGINLDDGGALTAFVLRRRDGSPVWAGGSHRPAGGAVRAFTADEVRFEPLREWRSPQSGARYPVRWRITTPLGSGLLEALLDAQELDSRASTGAVYWEGLAQWSGPDGRRLGRGYLEMTGRVAPLRLG